MPNVIDTTCLCRKSKFDCAKITMIDRQRRCPNWANRVVRFKPNSQFRQSLLMK